MDDWKQNYPTMESRKEPWPFLGYKSEMVNLALTKDDPVGFVGWMRECGLDNTSKTLDNLTMEAYCERRGAEKCKAALSQLEPIAA